MAAQPALQHLRIRIAWGGGSPKQWRGSISLSQGVLRHVTPLGVEADDPGSIWLARGSVWIQKPSPRTYDALDLQLSAPVGAKLIISLVDQQGKPNSTKTIETPLSSLIHDRYEGALDQQGNRILIRRSPGDSMRVQLDRSVLIYSPGEVLHARLQPYLLPIDDGATIRIKSTLTHVASGEEFWTETIDRRLKSGAPITAAPLEVKLPMAEGVYNLTIEAGPLDLRARIGFQRIIASRTVQFVILDQQSTSTSAAETAKWKSVFEFDPANPSWWKRLTEFPIPYLRRGPLDSGDVTSVDHPLGKLTQLAAKPNDSYFPWAAYALPVHAIGKPHILEIEYPGNVPQTLSVSIVEPNAAGHAPPLGLDSGFYLPQQAEHDQAGWQKHRLLFWPRTKAPLALLVNRQTGVPAVYGRIRILAGPDRLPRAFPRQEVPAGRTVMAYLDKPYFPKCFSAQEQADPESGRTLESWQTFYQGGTRLADYLQHVGYSGLILSVFRDGGALYPSNVLQPNMRYDSGAYFGNGQDPVKKDVLELLFQIFDREQLQLAPALDFSTPLPGLEALVREGGQAAVGIRWIDADGRHWLQKNAPQQGAAPYYNTLHPRVQSEMRRVVQELIARYGRHPSFTGLALQLSPRGYAQLPGIEWGFDDVTIAQFTNDTKIIVPGEGPNRFAERAKLLMGRERHRWLAWRAGKLSEFYRELQHDLAQVRPGTRLYLAGGNMLDSPWIEQRLRPSLSSRSDLAGLLLELGIDGGRLRGLRNVVFLRPHRIAPLHSLQRQAVQLKLDHASAFDAAFADTSIPASMFFHPPHLARLKSFDKVSPFKNSFTSIASQPLPSGSYNRQRFVHALASHDHQVLVDGGPMLPMGQEDAVKDLIATFRQLPPARFQTVAADKTQPVTVRSLSWNNRTYVYLANDSPWRTRVILRAEIPRQCTFQMLNSRQAGVSAGRDAAGGYWQLDLEPFELAAGWFSAAGIVLQTPQVQVHEQVLARLHQQIQGLASRVAMLQAPATMKSLSNPGFELLSSDPRKIPGWVKTREDGVTIRIDSSNAREGKASAFLASSGPVASLASEPFKPPRTGRLAVLVHLKVKDASRQPSLRIAIEGRYRDQSYYRHAPVGAEPGAAKRIGTQWERYIFPINDLPLAGLDQLRVRFDLMGSGEVWIDSVQLFDAHFSSKEHIELLKLIQLASVSLQDGKLSDCREILQSYWPRFLERNVPKPPPIPRNTRVAPAPPVSTSPPKIGWLDRMKKYVPGWMRF